LHSKTIPIGTGPSAARYSLGPSPHEKMGLGLYSKAVACYYPLPKKQFKFENKPVNVISHDLMYLEVITNVYLFIR